MLYQSIASMFSEHDTPMKREPTPVPPRILVIGIVVFLMLFFSKTGLSQQPGTILWSNIIGPGQPLVNSPTLISSPAVGTDGTIYIGASDSINGTSSSDSRYGSRLYAISPQGGTNWIYFPNQELGHDIRSSPSLAADGTVYCTSLDGGLVSLNPSGMTNWVFKSGVQVLSSTALGVDGTIYVLGISNRVNQLYAIRPDGTVRWTFLKSSLPTFLFASAQFPSPTIGPDGTIFCTFTDKRLYAVRLDGVSLWSYQLNDNSYGAPSVGQDGTVYIGTDSSTLYAITSQGAQKWQFHTAGIIETCPVLGPDGTLYVGCLDGNLYAVSPSGVRLWTFPAGSLSASPAIAGDGTIYVSSLTMISAVSHSGTILWNRSLGMGFSSPAIGTDGTVYVGIGQRLYAFAGTSPLSAAPWPMFRRNLNNSARATQCGLGLPQILPDGSLGISMTIEPSLPYRMQATVDFLSWLDLTNFTSADFSVPFIDTDATNFPLRFYRLTSP